MQRFLGGYTPVSPRASCEELTIIALGLRERALGPSQKFEVQQSAEGVGPVPGQPQRLFCCSRSSNWCRVFAAAPP
jgi:hypothetical protein